MLLLWYRKKYRKQKMALFTQRYSQVDTSAKGIQGKTGQELSDYFFENGLSPVYVVNTRGASLLGLGGKVLTKQQCTNLFELKSLDNAEENLKDVNGVDVVMLKGRKKSMVSEIIIGCSKSISIISAFDPRVGEMFKEKIDKIGQYLEEHYAAHADGQNNQAFYRRTKNYTMVATIHNDSRAKVGDLEWVTDDGTPVERPHLHVHLGLLNSTYDEKIKEWRAIASCGEMSQYGGDVISSVISNIIKEGLEDLGYVMRKTGEEFLQNLENDLSDVEYFEEDKTKEKSVTHNKREINYLGYEIEGLSVNLLNFSAHKYKNKLDYLKTRAEKSSYTPQELEEIWGKIYREKGYIGEIQNVITQAKQRALKTDFKQSDFEYFEKNIKYAKNLKSLWTAIESAEVEESKKTLIDKILKVEVMCTRDQAGETATINTLHYNVRTVDLVEEICKILNTDFNDELLKELNEQSKRVDVLKDLEPDKPSDLLYIEAVKRCKSAYLANLGYSGMSVELLKIAQHSSNIRQTWGKSIKLKDVFNTISKLEKNQYIIKQTNDGDTRYFSKAAADIQKRFVTFLEESENGVTPWNIVNNDPQGVKLNMYINEAFKNLGFNTISEEHRQVLENFYTSSDRCLIIDGVAGAGKSTLIKVIQHILNKVTNDKNDVKILSAQHGNTEDAKGEGHKDVQTISHYNKKLEFAKVLDDSERLVIVDEAGLVGVEQIETALTEIERTGSRLILIGDSGQLDPATREISLIKLAVKTSAKSNLKVMELTETHRAKGKKDRDMVKDLKTGITLTVGTDRRNELIERVLSNLDIIVKEKKPVKAFADLYYKNFKDIKKSNNLRYADLLAITNTNEAREECNAIIHQLFTEKNIIKNSEHIDVVEVYHGSKNGYKIFEEPENYNKFNYIGWENRVMKISRIEGDTLYYYSINDQLSKLQEKKIKLCEIGDKSGAAFFTHKSNVYGVGTLITTRHTTKTSQKTKALHKPLELTASELIEIVGKTNFNNLCARRKNGVFFTDYIKNIEEFKKIVFNAPLDRKRKYLKFLEIMEAKPVIKNKKIIVQRDNEKFYISDKVGFDEKNITHAAHEKWLITGATKTEFELMQVERLEAAELKIKDAFKLFNFSSLKDLQGTEEKWATVECVEHLEGDLKEKLEKNMRVGVTGFNNNSVQICYNACKKNTVITKKKLSNFIAQSDYGYVSTIHSTQGKTVDKTLFYAPEGDGCTVNGLYVALSRHRNNLQILTNAEGYLQSILNKVNKAATVSSFIEVPEVAPDVVKDPLKRTPAKVLKSIQEAKTEAAQEQKQEAKTEAAQEQKQEANKNFNKDFNKDFNKVFKGNYMGDYMDKYKEQEKIFNNDPDMISNFARIKFGEENKHSSTKDQLRFGSRGSVVVDIAGNRAGQWMDFGSGQGGHLFNDYYNMYKEDIKHNIKEDIKPETKQQIKQNSEPVADLRKASGDILERIAQLSKVSKDLKGTIGEQYLVNERKININDIKNLSSDVRFLGAAYSSEDKKNYPALFAIARNSKGVAQAAHIIYLNEKGQKARNLVTVKRSWGVVAGNFVTVFKGSEKTKITMIAEGIETSLSVAEAVQQNENAKDIKILCGLGVSNFKRYKPAKDEKIIICGDYAKENTPVAKLLEDVKAMNPGFIIVAPSSKHSDFNDVIREEGVEAVKAIIDPAITQALKSDLKFNHTATEIERDEASKVLKEKVQNVSEIIINLLNEKKDESIAKEIIQGLDNLCLLVHGKKSTAAVRNIYADVVQMVYEGEQRWKEIDKETQNTKINSVIYRNIYEEINRDTVENLIKKDCGSTGLINPRRVLSIISRNITNDNFLFENNENKLFDDCMQAMHTVSEHDRKLSNTVDKYADKTRLTPLQAKISLKHQLDRIERYGQAPSQTFCRYADNVAYNVTKVLNNYKGADIKNRVKNENAILINKYNPEIHRTAEVVKSDYKAAQVKSHEAIMDQHMQSHGVIVHR